MDQRDSIAVTVRRVAIVGAQSTGKSTLCDYLARQYGSVAVPEIGRYVWEDKQGRLGADDYVRIALRHRAAEDEQMPYARRYLFVDTNALSTLLLGLECGQLPAPVPAALLRCAEACLARYVHSFVCAPDFAHEGQAGQASTARRERLHLLLLRALEVRGIRHTLVGGSVDERALQVRRVLEGVG